MSATVAQSKKVYLYNDPSSALGRKAKQFLRSKGVIHTELDLAKDEAARAAVAKLGFSYTKGLPFPPVFDIGGQVIVGLDLYRLEKALEGLTSEPYDPYSKPM
ncbi:MAG: hypothetical protein HYX97_05065 [Chloroflexi bacterium]|nr:hypothetical protein [Chloroflexota bacterium]